MVNVKRSTNSPESLNNSKIQEYLTELAEYKELSVEKQKKEPIPKPPVTYRNSDLLAAFDTDFHGKCYLTEEKSVNSWKMDVEHFESKAEKPELRYEWTNLFPASHLANILKPRKDPNGGYLNPCIPIDDVEKEIVYDVGFNWKTYTFLPLNSDNTKAVNTAQLLNRLHNGHDENTNMATADLREMIEIKCKKLAELIGEWQQAKIENNKESEVRLSNRLKMTLSRKESFTMLCRSMSMVKAFVPKNLLD